MSTEMVEKINIRLREEIEGLGLSLADAARAANETSLQRLKDVVSGKQKCPIDLLVRLGGIGVSTSYVLTGQRTVTALAPDEAALVENYRAAPPEKQHMIQEVSSAISQYRDAARVAREKTGND